MFLVPRDNDALEVNPPAGDQYLSTNGSNWLWAVTAVFTVSFLAFFALGFKPRQGERIFHYLFTVGLLVGAISYFAMASDLGWVLVSQVNQQGQGLTRQIFFAKYVYWVVSFPTVIIALGLLSGVAWATIFYNVALAWTWVVSYLVSAFTLTNYKWGFFAFGTVAWLLLALNTVLVGRKAATRVGISRDYTLLAGWVNFLWLQYPLVFGLTDGGNRLKLTSGFIWIGILDLLMLPLVAFATWFLSRNWDYGSLNLHFTQYGRVAHGGTYPEKHAPPAAGITPAA